MSVTIDQIEGTVDLTGDQSILGAKTFMDPPVISRIRNIGTLTLPTTSGTLALTSDIVPASNFVDLTTPQSITGQKTFSAAPVISSISNVGTLTLPTATGTLALTSQIPSSSNFVDLSSAQSITGQKTFSNIFASNLVGCVFYSNPFGGGGSLSVDTASAGTASGIFRLPNIASTATYTVPSTSGFLLQSTVSYPSVASLGLTLSNNQTISDASYLVGCTINAASSTYTDSVTAASGTVTQVADVLLGARTFNATNTAVTYTNASTLRIAGPPIAGTNVTISTPNAILVDSGNISLTTGRYLSVGSGAAATPIFTIAGQGGFYSSAANTIALSTGGALRCSWSTSAMVLAANYAVTCSGTATITSGSGGFTSAGPVSSSLASSASACSVRPTNNANTGLFGTATTNCSIAVGGTAIVSCSTTGAAVTGTLSATGVSTLTGGARVGANGTQLAQLLQGSATFTAPNMANLGAVSQAVTFSTAFASTPLIFLTVVPATGSTFMDGVIASIGAGTATTTGFTIQLKNVSGSTTTGNVVVNWRAAA